MFGLIIAAIVGAWTVLIDGNRLEAGFFSATSFLWVWYWVWTGALVVLVVVRLLATPGATLFTTLNAIGSKLADFLDFSVNSAFPVTVTVIVTISRVLLLGGTHLLATSGTTQMSFAEFNSERLVVGGLLLGVGLLTSNSVGSSPNYRD